MTMRQPDPIRLFRTLPHACGYYPDRETENLVIDPESPALAAVFPTALAQGYRRAGAQIYRPDCVTCSACLAARVDVNRFKPNRTQKRVAKRNVHVTCSVEFASFRDEYFALYQKYLNHRHLGGGMDDADQSDFQSFLFSAWSPTRFLVFRENEALLMVAVTDISAIGLSAVYTFFDPDLAHRSLGTLGVLSQIALARSMQLPHVYLGYWIPTHAKMDYKANYSGLEIYRDASWQILNEDTKSLLRHAGRDQ